MSNTNSLTSHLWNLYHYIKHATIDGHKLTIKEIAETFPEEYHFADKDGNHSNCPKIYKDIDIINASDEVEKIIVKNNNNIHLATEEEAIDEALAIEIRALRLLKKYHVIRKKISADGQGKLISCQNSIIDEDSKARPFVEAFM